MIGYVMPRTQKQGSFQGGNSRSQWEDNFEGSWSRLDSRNTAWKMGSAHSVDITLEKPSEVTSAQVFRRKGYPETVDVPSSDIGRIPMGDG